MGIKMTRKNNNKNKLDTGRAFFTLEEGVCAKLNIPGSSRNSVPVTLLSISGGGIGFVALRHKLPTIHLGDRFTLTDIKTPQPLGTIDRADVSVTYVVDDSTKIRLSLGCEFINSNQHFLQRIRNFVKNRLLKLGLMQKQKIPQP